MLFLAINSHFKSLAASGQAFIEELQEKIDSC